MGKVTPKRAEPAPACHWLVRLIEPIQFSHFTIFILRFDKLGRRKDLVDRLGMGEFS